MKIKEGLQEKYDNYVKINHEDGYSNGVINAGERVGIALDEGKTPQEAIEALTEGDGDGLTVYMAGAAISAVCHFNPRGDELKVAWNGRYNVGPEADGVVNPAIMTVKDAPPQ